MKYSPILFSFSALLLLAIGAFGDQAGSVSQAAAVTQYGITWTFDRPYPVGQFVNGDWWVVGPAKVVSVNPAPQKAKKGEEGTQIKGRYGFVQFTANGDMRNGSEFIDDLPDKMKGCQAGRYDIRKVYIPAKENFAQGGDNMPHAFDSRDAHGYEPKMGVAFPCDLKPNQSLISSISYEEPIQQTFGCHEIHLFCDGQTILKTAAVLTCLDSIPPPDAFRPPYAGSCKPIFEMKNLQWDLLPKLPIPPQEKDVRGKMVGAPDWADMERLLQRPWIDRIVGGINENCVTYGREMARTQGLASLMLMLDVPKEKKEKLLVEVVQLGIDYYGLMKSGQTWIPDGGINIGRKWTIIFAGLMLGEKDFYNFPPWSLWQEDTSTYYGKAWDGQLTALTQVTWHSGPVNGLPYEEKTIEQRGEREGFASGYGMQNSDSYPAQALSALLMKAKAIWNHDAYFDYVDRYMRNDSSIIYFSHTTQWSHTPPPDAHLGAPVAASYDPFANAMWKAYRTKVPVQPGGKDSLKWVWGSIDMMKGYGEFVPNPKGSSSEPDSLATPPKKAPAAGQKPPPPTQAPSVSTAP